MAIIPQEIYDIKGMLDSMLGESKSELDHSLQLEYPCPRCVEKYGKLEEMKHNLSVSLSRFKFHCWKCDAEGDESMMGNLSKLFRMYGGDSMLREYMSKISSLKSSGLYSLTGEDKGIEVEIEEEVVTLPDGYIPFVEGCKCNNKALEYLQKRGIGWDVINKHRIGYTNFVNSDKRLSHRIILPSYDEYGNLNYWVGRDYTGSSKRTKYVNPKVEKRNIIFNEGMLSWDADVTIVEGPFDHIVVPNSVPLLGKSLNSKYKLYWDVISKANANVNIMLDGDAREAMLDTYRLLNHGRLLDKVRYVPMLDDEDPSSVYERYGWRGVAKRLSESVKVSEVFMLK